MGWTLTRGLQNLRAQVDAAFPDRSRASDGTIGDRAHMAETSGHNPDDTTGSRAEYNDHDGIAEVRAWDCTSNFGPGVDAQDVVDHLRTLPRLDTMIRYMIYNRRIYQAGNGWRPQVYTGASPHTEHIHFSGARTQAADNNTSFDYRLEEVPVALTAADKQWLADRIDQAATAAAERVWATKIPDFADGKSPHRELTAATWVGYSDSRRNDAVAAAKEAADRVVAALKPSAGKTA